jgi:hypothetical protein
MTNDVPVAGVKGTAMPNNPKTFDYRWVCDSCGLPAFYGNEPAKLDGKPVSSRDWYDEHGVHPEYGSLPHCKQCGDVIKGISSLVTPTPLDEALNLRSRLLSHVDKS